MEETVEASAVRQRLRQERTDLKRTVERIRDKLSVARRESAGDVALADRHSADAASETEARELDVARFAMFEARIGSIEEALARLERGKYGRCVVCGKPIPDARLELVPETPFCVDDAAREQERVH